MQYIRNNYQQFVSCQSSPCIDLHLHVYNFSLICLSSCFALRLIYDTLIHIRITYIYICTIQADNVHRQSVFGSLYTLVSSRIINISVNTRISIWMTWWDPSRIDSLWGRSHECVTYRQIRNVNIYISQRIYSKDI